MAENPSDRSMLRSRKLMIRHHRTPPSRRNGRFRTMLITRQFAHELGPPCDELQMVPYLRQRPRRSRPGRVAKSRGAAPAGWQAAHRPLPRSLCRPDEGRPRTRLSRTRQSNHSFLLQRLRPESELSRDLESPDPNSYNSSSGSEFHCSLMVVPLVTLGEFALQ